MARRADKQTRSRGNSSQPKWKPMSVNLLEEEADALKHLATNAGMNKTQVLREALKLYRNAKKWQDRGYEVYMINEESGDKRGPFPI